jgi:hypothetical protein
MFIWAVNNISHLFSHEPFHPFYEPGQLNHGSYLDDQGSCTGRGQEISSSSLYVHLLWGPMNTRVKKEELVAHHIVY